MQTSAGPRDPSPPRPLKVWGKILFASGDHTVSLSLSALSLLLMFFLTEVAGLRPLYAGGVVWLARLVDGFSDPIMGWISDQTRSRWGRRRPYFLLGAIPFGLFFSALWLTPFTSQLSMFAFYLAIYVGLCLSMTVVSVPYLALIPEIATSYDDRTSLHTFRAAGSVLGTLAAVGMASLADSFGGGGAGYFRAGALTAVWLVVPWPLVFAVSREPQRPGAADATARPAAERSIAESPALHQGLADIRSALRHSTYRRLCGFFISSRIAVDILGLSFAYFFTYVLGRPGDWQLGLGMMLVIVIASLPLWLATSKFASKHTLFCIGAGWWIVVLVAMFSATSDSPRWLVFALCGAVGVGYAIADLMPWAMLGEVIDEDRLRSGRRREGLYNGLFTFLRKLGGATAFLFAGALLDVTGYTGQLGSDASQPESALLAIRCLATVIPAAFLLLAIGLARGYPLTRERHDEILRDLSALENGPTLNPDRRTATPTV